MTFPPPIATTPVLPTPDQAVWLERSIVGMMAGLGINRLRIKCDGCSSGVQLIAHPDGELTADPCDTCLEEKENDVERQLKDDYEAAHPDWRVIK